MPKASKEAIDSTVATLLASAEKDPTLWKSPLFAAALTAAAKQMQAKSEAVAGLSLTEPRPRGRKRAPSWEHARAHPEPEVAGRVQNTSVAKANTETPTADMVDVEVARELVLFKSD